MNKLIIIYRIISIDRPKTDVVLEIIFFKALNSKNYQSKVKLPKAIMTVHKDQNPPLKHH